MSVGSGGSCRTFAILRRCYPSLKDEETPVIGDKWQYGLELEGRKVDIPEGESTIGRSRSCTVTLRDPSASRNHVLVTVKPGEVRARDLQSSNGTYLNGERLTGERLVHDGDRITIGETDIFVRIAAPELEEGGATVRLESATMQCPACGAELPVLAEQCSHCGHRMGEPAAPAIAAFDPAPAPRPSAPPPPSMTPAPSYAPPPLAGPAPAPRTEIYHDVAAMPPAPDAGHGAAGGELLPPIADDMFHTPGAFAASRPAAMPQPALPPTPPPRPLASYSAPPTPVAPYAAGPVGAAAPVAGTAHLGYRPAGFWIRVAATIVDTIWLTVLLVVATLPFGGPKNPTALIGVSSFGLLVWMVVAVFCWGVFGATPGKGLLGLRVIGGNRRRGIGLGRAFMRFCATMVSGMFFGVGYLMVAFTKDKRALHDHLAGTAVMRR